MLVNLPASVGQCITSRWLTGRSVGKLDAAFCNRAKRRYLFEIYDHCVLNIGIKYDSAEYVCMLRWVYVRRVRWPHFEFDSSLDLLLKDQLLVHSYLQKAVAWLKSVCIVADNEEMTAEVMGVLEACEQLFTAQI